MAIGAHSIKVFAIDQTGTVARTTFTYLIELSGPTASPHPTPAKSRTMSNPETASRSRSPSPTSTISQSPAPTRTPYPSLLMEEAGPGWNANFNLLGRTDDSEQNAIEISSSGFRTAVVDGLGNYHYIIWRESYLTTSDLFIETHITLMGAAALCVFTLANQANTTQSVSAALFCDLRVNGADGAACHAFSSGNGFYARADSAVVNFFVSNHPLVTDVDTFWFGPYQNWMTSLWSQTGETSVSGVDTAMAMSWTDRLVAPGERLVLSTVITWRVGGEPRSEPRFDVNAEPDKLGDPIYDLGDSHRPGRESRDDHRCRRSRLLSPEGIRELRRIGRSIRVPDDFQGPRNPGR
jgi:hypothetical protein